MYKEMKEEGAGPRYVAGVSLGNIRDCREKS